MIEHRIVKTRWGYTAFVAGRRGLVATFLPRPSRAALESRIRHQHPDSKPNRKLLPKLAAAFGAYFEGKPARFDVRLDLDQVTEFRRRVLEACRQIPPGDTATYADLARSAGSPNAARAAGSTMANNRLPLVVPCHRVVRSDGTLGGFSSPPGLELKRRLFQMEGAL